MIPLDHSLVYGTLEPQFSVRYSWTTVYCTSPPHVFSLIVYLFCLIFDVSVEPKIQVVVCNSAFGAV